MRPIWAASRFTRHRRPQWCRLSLGRGATSEATSAAVGGARPPLLRILPRGFPSPVTPAALLAAARLVAIINSHQIGFSESKATVRRPTSRATRPLPSSALPEPPTPEQTGLLA